MTKSHIENSHLHMLHVVCYDGSSKQSGRRQASISQRHLGSDIIILAETSIIICWPLGCLPISLQNKYPSVRSQMYRSFDYWDNSLWQVSLTKMQGMVTGNRSRENPWQRWDNDISRIERMISQIVRYVCYDGSSKQSGGGQASISQRHLGSDIINLAETSIYVGRNVHILWPKRPWN